MYLNDLRVLLRALLLEKAELAPAASVDWQPWPADVLDVKYEAPSTTAGMKGVGPGELRVAKMWRGKPMGGNVSYDVQAGDGTRWEVKAPGSRTRSGELRIEQKGIAAIQPKLTTLLSTIHAFQVMFDPRHAPDDVSFLDKVYSPEQLKFVRDFLYAPDPLVRKKQKDEGPIDKSMADNMMRGEITAQRVERFRDVLKVIAISLSVDYNKVKSRIPRQRQIATVNDRLNSDEELAPSSTGYDADVVMGVAKLLDIKNRRLMELLHEFGLSDANYVAQQFREVLPQNAHNAVVDPTAFVEEYWTNMVKPSQVFEGLDGVVLVDKEGYRVVAAADVDEAFYFRRVSKGAPYLGVR